MLVDGTNRRLHTVDYHIGIGHCGVVADGRQLVNHARAEARNYRKNFGQPIPPKLLCDKLASFVHYFTLYYSLRPFGASVVIAGVDPDTKKHEMYQIDPTGVSFKFYGCSLGKNKQAGKTEIEKQKLFNKPCKEVVKEIAKMMLTLHDEVKDKPYELELSWICEESGWKHAMVSKELRDEATQWAKDKVEEEEEEDDDDDDDEDEE